MAYAGSLPANVRLYGTTGGTGLAAYLDLKVTRGTISSGSFDSCTGFSADATDYLGQGAGVVYQGTLTGFADDYAGGTVDPKAGAAEEWTQTETHAYKLQLTVQDTNSAQGLTMTQTFTWEARNTTSLDYATEVQADSPVGYWRLGEASGTTVTATAGTPDGGYMGGPTLGVAGAVGDADTAVELAAGQYMDFNVNHRFLFLAPFTAEAWVKPTAATGLPRPIFSNVGANGGWEVYLSASNRVAFSRSGDGEMDLAQGTTALQAGTWYHVVATFDGSTIKVYVNGTEEASTGSASEIPGHSNTLRIGHSSGAGTGQYTGAVDEAAVYGAALSAARVQAHHDAAG